MMEISHKLNDFFKDTGFECHYFKVGWYNDKVREGFQLDYPYDTLAFIIISTPSMFEKTFIPFICRQQCTGVKDPVDECVALHFKEIQQIFPALEIDTIHDFEMHHSRKPKVLVQTAGHVSGAVRYYQRQDVKKTYWDEKKKIFGACIHPKFGGWFALRGVVIFKKIQVADLIQTKPPNVLKTDEEIINFLERFNGNWQDWTFRDVIEVKDKYSEDQKAYFATLPKERKPLIEQWKHKLTTDST